nr:hypothetical protein BaRGS_033593 [Batillaria attramentaria]
MSVRRNSFQSDKSNAKDATIARRLTTIVLTDFLCWFPVSCLGLQAFTGTPIPSEVNVALAIFVLPLNSALNPFLYTLNIVLEKRRKAREARDSRAGRVGVLYLGISEGNDQTAERGTATGLGYSSLDRDHPAAMEDCYA